MTGRLRKRAARVCQLVQNAAWRVLSLSIDAQRWCLRGELLPCRRCGQVHAPGPRIAVVSVPSAFYRPSQAKEPN